jgi:hypothetical protein
MPDVSALGLALSSVWIGFIGAISFMEAWVKFRSPLVTREVGLDVGRRVFRALNRVELVLAVLLLAATLLAQAPLRIDAVFTLVLLILVVQSVWLLPRLERRARQIVAGEEPSASPVHRVYATLEGIKAIALVALAVLHAGLL